jgi:FkbM family methyltransferase
LSIKSLFSLITFLGVFRKFLKVAPRWLLVSLAEFSADLRKEGIYPGWRFAIEEYKPTSAVLRRLAIWQEFAKRDLPDTPVRVIWYEGLVVNLRLGNDQSRCLYVSGSFDPNELWFLGQILKPRMCFVDIGANEGLYSIYAAKKVGLSGKIFSFEPSPRERLWLKRNVQANHLVNIQVLPQALADVIGEAVLNLADAEHNGQNTLGTFGYQGVTCVESVQVELTTLDLLRKSGKIPKIDVIKMDVEGAEFKVLKGSVDILQNDRPLLLIELFDAALKGQNSSTDEVLEWLAELGYEIQEFDFKSGNPSMMIGKPVESSVNIIARSAIHHDL